MNAVAIIASRVESRRFPGKVFKNIAGTPALHILLKRVAGQGIPVIVAVPPEQIGDYSERGVELISGVSLMAGDSTSPLHRMANIVRWMDPRPKWVVRITHDDILIDMESIRELIQACDMNDAGYGVCDGIVDAAGAEVIRADNLLTAADRRKDDTEFVSYFVRGEGMPYPKVVRIKPRVDIRRSYRLTMDYPDDAKVLDIVLRRLGTDAPVEAICRYLDTHPFVLRLNAQPLLSVYTCAQNAERWAIDCISSVITDPEVSQYVFVDDYSKDGTPEIVAAFADNKRIELVLNEKNMGLASSSNVALAACRGKYVMRLDADDRLLGFDGGLSDMMELIDKGAQVVYPAYYTMDEKGVIGDEAQDPREYHHIGGAMFDKRFLDELRFKEGLRHWDGLELHERINKAGAKVAYYDNPTWAYRQTPGSMSRSGGREREAIRRAITGAK